MDDAFLCVYGLKLVMSEPLNMQEACESGVHIYTTCINNPWPGHGVHGHAFCTVLKMQTVLVAYNGDTGTMGDIPRHIEEGKSLEFMRVISLVNNATGSNRCRVIRLLCCV